MVRFTAVHLKSELSICFICICERRECACHLWLHSGVRLSAGHHSITEVLCLYVKCRYSGFTLVWTWTDFWIMDWTLSCVYLAFWNLSPGLSLFWSLDCFGTDERVYGFVLMRFLKCLCRIWFNVDDGVSYSSWTLTCSPPPDSLPVYMVLSPVKTLFHRRTLRISETHHCFLCAGFISCQNGREPSPRHTAAQTAPLHSVSALSGSKLRHRLYYVWAFNFEGNTPGALSSVMMKAAHFNLVSESLTVFRMLLWWASRVLCVCLSSRLCVS